MRLFYNIQGGFEYRNDISVSFLILRKSSQHHIPWLVFMFSTSGFCPDFNIPFADLDELILWNGVLLLPVAVTQVIMNNALERNAVDKKVAALVICQPIP